MHLTRTFKKIAAATAVVVASLGAASPAWADITASATASGSSTAYTLVARITPDAQYVGRGKLYFVILHGSQIYVLSETRGFIPYTGGEPEAYRTIAQANETITVQGWNTTAQAGASIFVGYGSDVTDMISNGKFKLVATLPQAPAPTPTPTPTPTPPVVTNPYAAYSGSYLCYSQTGATYTVTATFTATQALVDTSRILTIPDYSFNVPFVRVDTSGDRIYATSSFPLRMVSLDTTPGASYPLGLGYGATSVSTPRLFVCSKR